MYYPIYCALTATLYVIKLNIQLPYIVLNLYYHLLK